MGNGYSGVGYMYDAGGNRVARGPIGSWSCDITTNGFTQDEAFVVGPGGEQLTEIGSNTQWRHTNIYAAGKLIGTYDFTGLHFHFDDPLGTRRAQASSTGALEAFYQSLPFGQEAAFYVTVSDPTENHFTGKERDAESGNDYFGARYYTSSTGRWLSPDMAGPDVSNPQTLNKYRYGLNNPLRFVDPNGKYEIEVHYYLTLALAYTAGYSFSDAQRIAAADQMVDQARNTSPWTGGVSARRNYHFTSASRRNEMWGNYEESGSLDDLGQYMHAYQDSYSHAGFGPVFGHLFAGHGPDKTATDPGKSEDMVQGTMDTLSEALGSDDVSLSGITDLLDDFINSTSKPEQILDSMKMIVRVDAAQSINEVQSTTSTQMIGGEQ